MRATCRAVLAFIQTRWSSDVLKRRAEMVKNRR
jgi:hypothetical protein